MHLILCAPSLLDQGTILRVLYRFDGLGAHELSGRHDLTYCCAGVEPCCVARSPQHGAH